MRRILLAWVDSGALAPDYAARGDAIDWLRIVPYLALHAAVLAVLWVGVSAIALATAVTLYAVRMFAITAFFHRYFAHKSFRTSRFLQFLFAALGTSAVQRGPLWWAAHHRHHHLHSDGAQDPHSPRRDGFLWAHTGWFLAGRNYAVRHELIRDLTRFPELRWLDRFDVIVPMLLAAALFALGHVLARYRPELGTSGAQLLVWGFCISTVALYHATFLVNSLAHRWGRRRYRTPDDSRNNWWIALLTLGEGWHNNHHHYPGAARQGFYWWEIDLTYYGLKALEALGLVWGLRSVPISIRDCATRRSRPLGARA